ICVFAQGTTFRSTNVPRFCGGSHDECRSQEPTRSRITTMLCAKNRKKRRRCWETFLSRLPRFSVTARHTSVSGSSFYHSCSITEIQANLYASGSVVPQPGKKPIQLGSCCWRKPVVMT